MATSEHEMNKYIQKPSSQRWPWLLCGIHLLQGACLLTSKTASGQQNRFLCFQGERRKRFSVYSAAIILSRAAVFSRGKEVISFPAFVCAWMRAPLLRQYSLVLTALSIPTKIYSLSLLDNSHWPHKKGNFLNWFDSPHLISSIFFFNLLTSLLCQNIVLTAVFRSWVFELEMKSVL